MSLRAAAARLLRPGLLHTQSAAAASQASRAASSLLAWLVESTGGDELQAQQWRGFSKHGEQGLHSALKEPAPRPFHQQQQPRQQRRQQPQQAAGDLLRQLSAQPQPRRISMTLWSAARGQLQLEPPQAQQLLGLLARPGTLRALEPRDVSISLWALARLGGRAAPQQLQQLADALIRQRRLAKPQELANTLWAIARMGRQLARPQLEGLAAAFVAKLGAAKPQEIANVLWACATMGTPLPEAAQLQQLLDALVERTGAAKPQELANALWAVATMGRLVVNQPVHTAKLQALLGALGSMAGQAAPQELSNALWAMASLGEAVAPEQVQAILSAVAAPEALVRAKPQELANTLWALGTLGQPVPPQQLEQLVVAFVSKSGAAKPQELANFAWAVGRLSFVQYVAALLGRLEPLLDAFVAQLGQAKPQEVANTLWACAQLDLRPLQLLSALEQPQHLQRLLASGPGQHISALAWACGQLGYSSEALPGALLREAARRLADGQGSHLGTQQLANLAWSAAVLDLQQLAGEAVALAAACSKQWSAAARPDQQQLHQVHVWLQDSGHQQGLAGALAPEQLEQCREGWAASIRWLQGKPPTGFQLEVFQALQALPAATWQQAPRLELLTDDKQLSMDIAAVTAAGQRLAIEADGPTHFTRPGWALTGPTLWRNRALAARGWTVLSVPRHEWKQLADAAGKQAYLQERLAQAAAEAEQGESAAGER